MNVNNLLSGPERKYKEVHDKPRITIWRGDKVPDYVDQGHLLDRCMQCGSQYPNTRKKPDSIWYKITKFFLALLAAWVVIGICKMVFSPKSEPNFMDVGARQVWAVIYKVVWEK